MQSSSNRSVVIISGLLTLLVLGGAMLTLAFRNGWLQAAPTEPGAGAVTSLAQAPDAGAGRTAGAARGVAPVSPRSRHPTTGADQGEVAIYRGELEDAYRALDEAYTQVRALQAAQSQVGPRGEREHESAEHHDEWRERRSRHRDADDD